MRLWAAFLRRDLWIEAGYGPVSWLGPAGRLVGLLSFFLLDRAVASGPLLERWGGDWFSFVVVGLAVQEPVYAALTEAGARLREARLVGTLEVMLVSPLSATQVVVAGAVSPVLGGLLRMGLILALGVALGARLEVSGAGMLVLTVAAAIVASMALGLLGASFTLLFQRGDPIATFVHVCSALLGGVLYPVEVLPEGWQAVAWAVPLTHALEAARQALLSGATGDGWAALGRLVALTVVLIPASLWVFGRAAAGARADGTLGAH